MISLNEEVINGDFQPINIVSPYEVLSQSSINNTVISLGVPVDNSTILNSVTTTKKTCSWWWLILVFMIWQFSKNQKINKK